MLAFAVTVRLAKGHAALLRLKDRLDIVGDLAFLQGTFSVDAGRPAAGCVGRNGHDLVPDFSCAHCRPPSITVAFMAFRLARLAVMISRLSRS